MRFRPGRDESKRNSTPSSSSTEIFEHSKAEVPPGTYLVQAPFEFKRKNSRVDRNFLILKSDWSNGLIPDVSLRTKNALLRSNVYLAAPGWGRPVFIHARTKNSALGLGIHTLQADQPIHVQTRTKNATSNVLLPRDFKGLLVVSIKNGTCTLSEELMKVALLIPSQCEEKVKDAESLDRRESFDSMVSDVPGVLSNGVDVSYGVNGDVGPSVVNIRTKKGNVFVGFVQDEEVDDKAGCWAGCSVM